MTSLPQKVWKKTLLVLFAITGLIVIVVAQVPSFTTMRSVAEHLGPAAVFVFFLAYVFFTQFPIPRSLFTISAGVLFGPFIGIAVALLATTLSAALSLALLRTLIDAAPNPTAEHPSLMQKIAHQQKNHPALSRINARLEQRGGVAVFFLRLMAGIPFSVLNYACVLTPVRIRPFVIATFFGSAPSTAAGVLLGEAATGSHDGRMLWVLGSLFVIGLIGILIDYLVPVKSNG